MPDISNWQFPKNVAGKVIGWAANGRELENKAHLDASSFPTLSSSQKNKKLTVNTAGDGYELRRNPFYDLYEYGATGNAATDDTAAIVLCQTASNANEGIQAAPKGRGVIVVPPGNFMVSSITTQNSGEKWLGLGGTITATGTAVDLFTVAHASCIIRDIRLVIPTRPTVNVACLVHSAGADCLFDGVVTTGGYYGIKGTGGGDSSWHNVIVNAPYAHSVYFIGYRGAWVERAKWDASWPVSQPTSAQITGAMVNGAVYAASDMVTSNGWWFQCLTPGTAPAAGNLSPATFGTVVTSTGTATWLTGRVSPSANLWIDSGTFICKFTDSDISGGHDYSIMLTDSLATTDPQDMYFKGVEAGGAIYTGVFANDADGLQFCNGIVHSLCASNGIGIHLDNAMGVLVSGNNVRGCPTGIYIGSGARSVRAGLNNVYGATTAGLDVAANAQRFNVHDNDLSGNTLLWGVNTIGLRIGSGCTNFRVNDNDIGDATTPLVDSSSVNAVKRMRGNF